MAIHEAYCDENEGGTYCVREVYDPNGPGILVRQAAWDGVVKLFDKGSPEVCRAARAVPSGPQQRCAVAGLTRGRDAGLQGVQRRRAV